jgi:hypothetical protein
MNAWAIIRSALIDVGVAVIVVGIFSLGFYAFSLIFSPTSLALWWFSNIDLMLEIIVPTVLAFVFLNSFLRIALDAVKSAWKGFLHVSPNIILA